MVALAVGQPDEGEDASGLGGKAQGFGPFKADGPVLAFDPDRLEADLRRQRDE